MSWRDHRHVTRDGDEHDESRVFGMDSQARYATILVKGGLVVRFGPALAGAAVLTAMLFAAAQIAPARDRTVEIMDLDTIVKTHPLPPGGPSASVVASRRAGKGELQIVLARKIPLHIHDQDHVVFVERGTGTARIENAAGEIETHPVTPGDIVDVPRGRKHAFETTGAEDMVLLVVTTPSRTPPKFFE